MSGSKGPNPATLAINQINNKQKLPTLQGESERSLGISWK